MKMRLYVRNFLSPMQTRIAGATVAGKPNYMNVVWMGIVESEHVSISVGRERYSHRGILENKTFLTTIQFQKMLALTDHCGSVSWKKADSASLFTNFSGKFGTAPMTEECPMTIVYTLADILEICPTRDVFIGEIVETYCDEEYVKDGKPDFDTLDPIHCIMSEDSFWKMGERVARMGNVHESLGK